MKDQNNPPCSTVIARHEAINSQLIKVMIIDDHKMFVEGIERIINESGIAQVVAKAYTVREGRLMLSGEQADVLLLDIHLPDGNGIDLCAEILTKYPNMKILALTSFSEYTVVNRMLNNGALGYLLKNAMAEEILQGIETVNMGEKFICEEVNLLLKKQSGQAVVLTGREEELLRLICEGYINIEIADKMCLGVETINSYRKNLLFKLQARNTAVLVKMAIEQKII
ncbi:MAG: response regulator transcription factor [Bacteroidales bacterium]|nr:response regulator transcription factor [Bacteroidales bacterium]